MTETVIKKIPEGRYIEAVGRRKTSIARVRIEENKSGKGAIVVNKKPFTDYFKIKRTQLTAGEALAKVKGTNKFNVSVLVRGGGAMSQAEAVRHGLSRALVVFEGEWRDRLKKAGFLKRDPRAKERRKFGLKKARKAPQWSKR
ncbi:MAG: 30S ribosomal protein S9 [Parcubacteria group bacterium]|nr:30S ribosomal protein S9 [Parcubacteria group bacterium]